MKIYRSFYNIFIITSEGGGSSKLEVRTRTGLCMFFNMRTYRVLSVSILIHVLYIFKNIMSNYSLCVLLIRDLNQIEVLVVVEVVVKTIVIPVMIVKQGN